MYTHRCIKNNFALNEAELPLRLFVRNGIPQSPQDDEALIGCSPWEMGSNTQPWPKKAGSRLCLESRAQRVIAWTHWIYLHKRFLRVYVTWFWNTALNPWERKQTDRCYLAESTLVLSTLAVAVETCIYYSEARFSLKGGVLMNTRSPPSSLVRGGCLKDSQVTQ